jgi:rhodanese-related sulfurtransferase
VSRTPEPRPAPTIAGAELCSRLEAGEPIWLIHVPASSFARGHLLGAVAFGELARIRDTLQPQDTVVVYGPDAACTASRDLVVELRRHGYGDSWWFADGLRGWAAAGGDVEALRRGTDDRTGAPAGPPGQSYDGPTQAR